MNFEEAFVLKESSDEKRLQPIYVQLFFERAFKHLGGEYVEVEPGIYQITHFPALMVSRLKSQYKLYVENMTQLYFCFDKQIFLDYRNANSVNGKAHYINPGNALFDCLVDVVRDEYRDDMLKGTILVSPDDKESYLAFYVKNQVTDNRTNKSEENIVNELLSLVYQTNDGEFHMTSPAKFLDLVPPTEFAKEITPPEVKDEQDVLNWAFENIAIPMYGDTQTKVQEDTARRKEYLQEAFKNIIFDITTRLNELQGKALMSDDERIQNALSATWKLREDMIKRREERLKAMDEAVELSIKRPSVLGCAYVVPLNQVEYRAHFGMSRDDEVEAVAMQCAMDYERAAGRNPRDVSKDNMGYDIRSEDALNQKYYIEVKGRAGTDGVMLSENEVNRLKQLGKKAWLYIVVNCRTAPTLYAFNDPVNNMSFDKQFKGVQFYLPLDEWQSKLN